MGNLSFNQLMGAEHEKIAKEFNSLERENESRRLEAEACRLVSENRFLIGMKPAVKHLLLGVANLNNWQILKAELEKK